MIVEINLLPKRKERSLTSLIVILVILAIIIISSIIFFFHYNSLKTELQTTQETIQVTEQLRGIQEQKLQETPEASTIDVIESQINWIQKQKMSSADLLSRFVEKLPERGYFMNYTFVDEGTVQISIQFDTPAEVSAYLFELTDSTFIEEANLLSITAEEMEEVEDSEEEILPRYLADFTVKLNVAELLKEEGDE
ncbi:PilN domain-containing protein [Bacillus suaedae]|uniref:Fimbrial assembly protein n=1 Tax=Halalkalibacter suaedae TaxID=2822140 RepID=A0A940WWT0_9BACI|nr:PilN domain-containing protein [Bacillus suaedae]MBP3949650.1 hypothetical protein [Bacillus suaedae]